MIVAVEVTEKPHMRVGVHRTVEIEVMKADVWFRQSNVWGPTFPARRAFSDCPSRIASIAELLFQGLSNQTHHIG